MTGKLMFFAMLLAASGLAFADAAKEPTSLTRAEFEDLHRQTLTDLSDGKTYAEIAPDARTEVVGLLDSMSNRFTGYERVSDMPQDRQVNLFNEQERVNAILTRAREDSRVSCIRDTPTGSHRRVVRCQTQAERRRAREYSQDEVRRSRSGYLEPGG